MPQKEQKLPPEVRTDPPDAFTQKVLLDRISRKNLNIPEDEEIYHIAYRKSSNTVGLTYLYALVPAFVLGFNLIMEFINITPLLILLEVGLMIVPFAFSKMIKAKVWEFSAKIFTDKHVYNIDLDKHKDTTFDWTTTSIHSIDYITDFNFYIPKFANFGRKKENWGEIGLSPTFESPSYSEKLDNFFSIKRLLDTILKDTNPPWKQLEAYCKLYDCDPTPQTEYFPSHKLKIQMRNKKWKLLLATVIMLPTIYVAIKITVGIFGDFDDLWALYCISGFVLLLGGSMFLAIFSSYRDLRYTNEGFERLLIEEDGIKIQYSGSRVKKIPFATDFTFFLRNLINPTRANNLESFNVLEIRQLFDKKHRIKIGGIDSISRFYLEMMIKYYDWLEQQQVEVGQTYFVNLGSAQQQFLDANSFHAVLLNAVKESMRSHKEEQMQISQSSRILDRTIKKFDRNELIHPYLDYKKKLGEEEELLYVFHDQNPKRGIVDTFAKGFLAAFIISIGVLLGGLFLTLDDSSLDICVLIGGIFSMILGITALYISPGYLQKYNQRKNLEIVFTSTKLIYRNRRHLSHVSSYFNNYSIARRSDIANKMNDNIVGFRTVDYGKIWQVFRATFIKERWIFKKIIINIEGENPIELEYVPKDSVIFSLLHAKNVEIVDG